MIQHVFGCHAICLPDELRLLPSGRLSGLVALVGAHCATSPWNIQDAPAIPHLFPTGLDAHPALGGEKTMRVRTIRTERTAIFPLACRAVFRCATGARFAVADGRVDRDAPDAAPRRRWDPAACLPHRMGEPRRQTHSRAPPVGVALARRRAGFRFPLSCPAFFWRFVPTSGPHLVSPQLFGNSWNRRPLNLRLGTVRGLGIAEEVTNAQRQPQSTESATYR